MSTRRSFLIGGAGLATSALAALGYRAWDRGVWAVGNGSSYAPWSDWEGRAADGIKRPLRAAVLAANPHDTQPWLLAVRRRVTLFADRARNLGTFDPFRREMHLGLGAVIENLVIATEVRPTEGRLELSLTDRPLC